MWILLVLSNMYGTDEIKVTQYDTYKTKQECAVQLKKLKSEFKTKEEALCLFVPSDKPLKKDFWQGIY